MSNILLVDSDASSKRRMRDALEREEHQVVDADSGAVALERLQRGRFDLVIADILAPDFDGIHLCFALRQNEHLGGLPFLIMAESAHLSLDRELARLVGADDFLVKPATQEDLLLAVKRTLEMASGRSAEPTRASDEFAFIRRFSLVLMARIKERDAALIQSTENLRASEERFRQLAGSIREVFWLAEPAKGKLLYVSPAYELIWGEPVDVLMRSPHAWIDAVHPEDRKFVRGVSPVAIREEVDEIFRIIRPDGATRWIRQRTFPVFDAAGEVIRIAGVAEDVTESKHLEGQFRQAQKMEAIGRLAGGVAHDFNNILTVIKGNVSLLGLEPGLPPACREIVGEIARAADRAANLTRQLLTFSRRQTMEPRNLDLSVVVTGVTRMLQRLLGEDIGLELRLAPQSVGVLADQGMLEQVLVNLAVNARDAMPDGGRLTIETSVESFDETEGSGSMHKGDFACLTVADTGVGIAPEVMGHIFEPFFTTKDCGSGTGLGLATVHGIVQQHGGWIEVQSARGEGARFQVFLPRVRIAPEQSMDSAGARSPRRGQETILFVEDEPSLRTLARNLLVPQGYRIVEASSGPQALDLWRLHRSEIRLLITDMVMPDGMSGLDLTRRLRALDPRLRVILTSGYSPELWYAPDRIETADAFVAKPYDMDRLLVAIRSVLDE